MFYKQSVSRAVLNEWLLEIFEQITPANQDRATVDAISATEIIDLAYLEGVELSEAIAAHALFPGYVEQEEAQRGNGATSSMEVIFPIKIEEETWGYKVDLRAGRPSMLAVGQGGVFPRVNPDYLPPLEMISPRINGTQYEIQEPEGNRLQALAGPMEQIEWEISNIVTKISGSQIEQMSIAASNQTYCYIDGAGTLHLQTSARGLDPLEQAPENINNFYLREHRIQCDLQLEVSWKRLQADQVLMTVALRNVSTPPQDRQRRARDIQLSALILPHLQVTLKGARAIFPAQQYAEAKQQMLSLSERERSAEARRRLYQVRQSGCIATLHPANFSQLSITTFGIFDTPREIPTLGPSVEDISTSAEEFLEHLPQGNETVEQFVRGNWGTIQGILLSAADAFNIDQFRQFQWQAIATGIELEATGRQKVVTIVRAPTNAGKTVVFLVNAAISSLCGGQRSSSILLFPTRILNEDMFRRLTAFVYRIRERLPQLQVTGGILMGTSDPLYRLILNPQEGEVMHHYGACPACNAPNLTAQPQNTRRGVLATCTTCNHVIDYMFNPREVMTYLPDIVIATPDKLFFEATVQDYELYRYGLFGASVRRCQDCDRAYPTAGFTLQPKKNRCRQVFTGSSCPGSFSESSSVKPIRYMGFDEVHSLYGTTATYLSVFLATLEVMQRVLSSQPNLHIRYETATATISNETDLLEALTRRYNNAVEIIAIPSNDQLADSFIIDENSIRQRVLLSIPSRVSSRVAFIRSTLNSYLHLRGPNADLREQLNELSSEPEAWNFLLGYVFRKQDGLDLRRALGDFYRNRFGDNLNIEFLSGEAPKNQISRILHQALDGELDILLANLVISLGIDIHGLNHMIMFGVPRGFTEYVQTAGRTGRGGSPGHVSVILLPNSSRDAYLYRHFHAILSDVAGYYDILPVRSTNLYCSEEIFGNAAKGLLSALCVRNAVWPHRTGLLSVTESIEGRIRGGIASILCDDAALHEDTAEIVRRKYRQLMNEIQSQSKFLSELMRSSEQQWLIYSLRGRSGNTVRLTCADQPLAELISARTQDILPNDETGEENHDEA